MIRLIQRVGLAAAILFIPQGLWGQLTPAEKPSVGDTPATPPPLETDLSPELTRKNKAVSSYVFGAGTFLLAGSEVYRLAH